MYVRTLGFVDKPDYHHLRMLMKAVVERCSKTPPNEYSFEWMPPPSPPGSAAAPNNSGGHPLSPYRAAAIYASL